jgi:hypothetical protein
MDFSVTDSPTAAWTAQRVAEAFPWNEVPRYLIRDRDAIYASEFRSVRRELLDHVIVLDEAHLRRRLRAYAAYHHGRALIWRSTRMRQSPASSNHHLPGAFTQ